MQRNFKPRNIVVPLRAAFKQEVSVCYDLNHPNATKIPNLFNPFSLISFLLVFKRKKVGVDKTQINF